MDNRKLRYRAPRGIVTADLLADMKANRAALMGELDRDARITGETVERLRKGQLWLRGTVNRHMNAGHGGDRLWLRGLDVWDNGTRILYHVLHYERCIWWPERVCLSDTPVCCVACGQSGDCSRTICWPTARNPPPSSYEQLDRAADGEAV